MTRKPATRLFLTIPALALTALALALILHPTPTPYLDLLRQGDAHAANIERTRAVAAYQEAARLQFEGPTPHLRLAQLYLDWGRPDEALAALTEAGRLSAGESEKAERLHVAIHADRADWPAVVEHARRLLTLTPADRDARHALARAYLKLQEWDAAQAEYEELLNLDPADQAAHERLGTLLLGDDPTAAIQHLYGAQTDLANRLLAATQESSATGDPAYTCALQGRALFEAQEWSLVARQFERALSHNPDYAGAHAYLGHALDQIGRPVEALPHLQQAVALAPDSVAAHIFLGLHYDRLGNSAAARAEYEAAYDLDPENPAICVEIGQTWAAERRYTAAEIWLKEAVALQPNDPALWEALTRFYLGHNIAALGQATGAASELLKLSPDDARAHDLRGWALFQAGDFVAARSSLQEALSLDPTLASAHYHLGRVWDVQGERKKAQEAYVRALDLDITGELVPLIERVMGELP
ncbi:MAG: tetratricopeptide repeat protein [Chloroflexota bacterium]|nr:tetratricopeptide repeat protein [Chloroflexota bacterium]